MPSDTGEWDGMPEARRRSAVNRAYYSLFLFVKTRLEGARRGFKLPRVAVHTKVRRALEDELGHGHLITQGFRDLQRDRATADYDLTPTFTDSEAEDLITTSLDTMDAVAQLTTGQLQSLAGALVWIDQQWPA